jgi:hypothetical protein
MAEGVSMGELVGLSVGSWNRIGGWLRRVDALRSAA